MNIIEIWKPKYSTLEFLVATHKVIDGYNYIRITQDPAYARKTYRALGEDIRKCKTQSNGKGTVYLCPIHMFEVEWDR